MDRKYFTRQELYDLVWATPMMDLAPTFNLSDVGLKKICRTNDVPVPPRGYWNKVHASRPTEKTPLPRGQTDRQIGITIKEPSPNSKALRQSAERTFSAISVKKGGGASRIVRALVADTKRALKAEVPDEKYGVVKSDHPGQFFIRVAPKSIPRAISLLESLLVACEGVGLHVDRNWPRQAALSLGTTSLSLSVEERVKQIPHTPTPEEVAEKRRWSFITYPKYDFVPTGELTIKASSVFPAMVKTSWSDSPEAPLETRIHQVVQGLMVAMEARRLEDHKADERLHAAQIVKANRQAQEKQAEAERAAFERLFRDADMWSRVEQAKRYLSAIEQTISSGHPNFEGASAWLRWARNRLEASDPLKTIDSLNVPGAAVGE
ncbi:hypothetical protein [Aminobacter niigataensis]|uniref:hypothetical protein n=1 Tax=Aminobacter niigataensis TaxID=83265 RepID=UPI0024CC2736|nr:hypothetical protein [Aminobacter niigataensis]CAI2932454.1 conserved protein of unknown function [Aminobacter niigataensis]